MPTEAGVWKVADLCEHFNTSRDTILRWEREGWIPLSMRDSNGARTWNHDHVDKILRWRTSPDRWKEPQYQGRAC